MKRFSDHTIFSLKKTTLHWLATANDLWCWCWPSLQSRPVWIAIANMHIINTQHQCSIAWNVYGIIFKWPSEILLQFFVSISFRFIFRARSISSFLHFVWRASMLYHSYGISTCRTVVRACVWLLSKIYLKNTYIKISIAL